MRVRASSLSRSVVLTLAVTGLVLPSASARAAGGADATRGDPISRRTGAQAIAHRERPGCGVGGRARCGTIEVPVDHADPAGAQRTLAYLRYPRLDRDEPSLGTVVAIQGGPGYSTLNGDFYYHEPYRPLLRRRSLLLVDLRGTGASDAVDCGPLQTMSPVDRDAWVRAVGRCGRSLGDLSGLYTTAQAADDLALLLDELGIGPVDLYGDSYGTYFAQSFATRYPSRLRSLVLDSAYPASGPADPWALGWHGGVLEAMRRACARDAACDALPQGPIARLRRLLEIVRDEPLVGRAPDGAGVVGPGRVDPSMLIALASGAGYSATAYREFDAAVRAALPPSNDPVPLVRRAREADPTTGGGSASSFSYGLYYATTCTDYPQLYDMADAPSGRIAAYEAALADVAATDPDRFAPWRVDEWTRSYTQDFDACLRWPAPVDAPEPAVDPGEPFPDVPTLVLAGDLDSVTTPADAAAVAGAFPDATLVTVPNRVHITALADERRCVADIVRRFTRSLDAGATDCIDRYAPIRLVDDFADRSRDLVDSGRRIAAATAAASTVADVVARWWEMWTYDGAGLRGGAFSTWGWNQVGFRLERVRWVEDVWVSGRVRWGRITGIVEADVTIGGRRAPRGRLRLRWNDLETDAVARIAGVVGGRPIRLTLPAP